VNKEKRRVIMIAYPISDFVLERVTPSLLEHRFCLYLLKNDPSVEKELFISETEEEYPRFANQKNFGSGYYLARMGKNCVFYLEVGPINFTASISYATLKAYRNQGYATHILKETIEKLFEIDGVLKVTAIIGKNNQNSLATIRKLGFEEKQEQSGIYELQKTDFLAKEYQKEEQTKVTK